MNARSLSNKISHLHLFLNTFDPDLVLVTETWLSSKMNNSEITFNLPYTVFRTDRKLSGIKKCRGGGVCCIAKDTINLYPIAVSAVSSCIKSDLLCLEGFDFVRSFKFRMILIYRPPKSSVEDDDSLIDTLLDLFLCDLHLIVLGDFNLDINWDLNQGRNSTSVKFLNFFHSFGLKQHVMNPTRCSSVLDIILTSAPIIKNMSLHPPLGTADHNVIGFEICGSFPKPRAYLFQITTVLPLRIFQIIFLSLIGGRSFKDINLSTTFMKDFVERFILLFLYMFLSNISSTDRHGIQNIFQPNIPEGALISRHA